MLQQGFGRSSEQNRGLGGDVRLKSGEHLPAAVPTAVGVQKREAWLGPPKHYRKYIAPREILTYRGDLSAVFTMCYANAHAAILESTYTEHHRRCLKGYDRASK